VTACIDIGGGISRWAPFAIVVRAADKSGRIDVAFKFKWGSMNLRLIFRTSPDVLRGWIVYNWLLLTWKVWVWSLWSFLSLKLDLFLRSVPSWGAVVPIGFESKVFA
jgi:hypothetical protein